MVNFFSLSVHHRIRMDRTAEIVTVISMGIFLFVVIFFIIIWFQEVREFENSPLLQPRPRVASTATAAKNQNASDPNAKNIDQDSQNSDPNEPQPGCSNNPYLYTTRKHDPEVKETQIDSVGQNVTSSDPDPLTTTTVVETNLSSSPTEGQSSTAADVHITIPDIPTMTEQVPTEGQGSTENTRKTMPEPDVVPRPQTMTKVVRFAEMVIADSSTTKGQSSTGDVQITIDLNHDDGVSASDLVTPDPAVVKNKNEETGESKS